MKGSAPRRRTSRRKMNGLTAKSAMDDLSDMAQVGAGIFAYMFAAQAAAKQWPTVNKHALNAGALVLSIVAGSTAKPVRKVAIGFGASAAVTSAMALIDIGTMTGHTLNRRNLTAAQQQAIAAEMRKAQARMDSGMGAGGTLNGELETLNGAAEDLM